MAKERVFTYRNTGTEEAPVWEKWFQKTVADAVLMSDADNESNTIVDYVNEKISDLIGGAPGTYDTLKEIADYIKTHEDVVNALNAAIGNKVDKVTGKGLSTNDYTTSEKSKLSGIAAGAEVNVQSDWGVTDTASDAYIKNKPTSLPANGGNAATVGGHTVAVDVPAGAKFTDTTYSAFKGATSSAAGTTGLVPPPTAGSQSKYLRADGTWQTPPDTNTTYAVATTSANGLMSSADKSKLDGIASSANNYIHPSTHAATMITPDSTHRFVTDAEKSTWNAKAGTAVATTSANGLMSSADKTKLNNLPQVYFESELPASAPAGSICFLI